MRVCVERGDGRCLIVATWGLRQDCGSMVSCAGGRVLGDHRFRSERQTHRALKDPNPRARFVAAIALGKIGHKPAVEPLFAMLAENADKIPSSGMAR